MSHLLGATRTKDVKELIHARQNVVVHAKAYRLQAIDMVYINFKGISHTHVSDDHYNNYLAICRHRMSVLHACQCSPTVSLIEFFI